MTTSTINSGLSPRVLFHRSHEGQLAIGAAMIDRDPDDELAECYEAVPASGGWRTRFDGGRQGTVSSDLPCDVVAMYVEGLFHAWGGDEDWDSVIVTHPVCYSAVVFRWPENKSWSDKRYGRMAGDQVIYLQSFFQFTDRVANDGAKDLKEALEVARLPRGLTYQERLDRRDAMGLTRDEGRRLCMWHHVAKKRVPGRVRCVLHRTIKAVDKTVAENFGQGADFFKLPGKRK